MQCGIQKICGSSVAAAAAAPATAAAAASWAAAAAAGAASTAPLADYAYNIKACLFKKSGLTEIRSYSNIWNTKRWRREPELYVAILKTLQGCN